MSEIRNLRDREGVDMLKPGEQPPKRNPPGWLLVVLLAICLGTIGLAVKWGVDAREHKPVALGPPAAPPARPVADPAAAAATKAQEAAETAEENARFEKGELTMQVRGLLCEESAERYMKARTGVEFQRQIQISQANGCGWKYIMAADAKTHGLTKEALEAAADIEEDEVTAADGGAAAAADEIDAMKRRLSDAESEVQRLRYRSNYR